MKTFVIIFRQGPSPLSDADLQSRAEETRAWARQQNDAGHKLDPHILTAESVRRGPDSPALLSGDAWKVTALLFLEAHDLNEASTIAEAHPALRYGANVEVRAWERPGPLPVTGAVK